MLYHSTDMSNGAYYNLRMNLHGGAWITKITPEMVQNEDMSVESGVVLREKRLETNRLAHLFDPERAYGGFFVKIKVKQEYTGLSFAKEGEEEDPILSVKDHSGQGKQEGMLE